MYDNTFVNNELPDDNLDAFEAIVVKKTDLLSDIFSQHLWIDKYERLL